MQNTATQSQSIAAEPAHAAQGRDILCFSHDWSGDPLSKTHLMRLLARDNRILWVNSIGYRAPTVSKADLGRIVRKLAAAAQPVREVEPNIFVLNPLAIPAYGRPWIRRIQSPAAQLPGPASHAAAEVPPCDQLDLQPGRGRHRRPPGRRPADLPLRRRVHGLLRRRRSRRSAELEGQLLRQADLVIVSADRLYQSKAHLNPHTLLVRHGVDFDHFRTALDSRDTESRRRSPTCRGRSSASSA